MINAQIQFIILLRQSKHLFFIEKLGLIGFTSFGETDLVRWWFLKKRVDVRYFVAMGSLDKCHTIVFNALIFFIGCTPLSNRLTERLTPL